MDEMKDSLENGATSVNEDAATTGGETEEKPIEGEDFQKIDEKNDSESGSQTQKVFCVKCGAEISPGAVFCPKCGHKVGEKLDPERESADSNSKKTVEKKKNKIGLVIGVAVAVVAIIIIIHLVRGTQAKSVTLNKNSVSVKAGETTTLNYTIDPSDTKDKTVTWESSNDSIAKVSNGTVTGVNVGDCTITVTTKNGKTDTCDVTILPAGPDLQAIYDEYCSSEYATIASDGSYLTIDTNPSDIDDYSDSDAIAAILAVNEALELPDSVLNKMGQTRAMDGMQSYSTDDLEISWTYHPDNGLEVNYTLK